MVSSDFHVSLLGKHFWRIEADHNSILSKTLKSKYFPKGTIKDAKVGYTPSYVWRNIFSARDLVLEGSRWCIGNGSNVKVWTDGWLPKNAGFKALSPRGSHNLEALISDLIDHNLNT